MLTSEQFQVEDKPDCPSRYRLLFVHLDPGLADFLDGILLFDSYLSVSISEGSRLEKKIDRIPEATAQQMNSPMKAKEWRAKLPQTEAVEE
jgi:hypothetical protein